MPLSFELGETPKLIEQPWCDPTSPGVPDPSLGTSGCASGCLPGTWCDLSRNRRGIGTTLLPWHRQCPLDVPKPCPSVHRSAASWHCCGVLAQLTVGMVPCTGGTRGLSHSGTGLRGVGICSGEGFHPQHSPGPPNSLPGCKAQPSQASLFLGSTVPQPDPARASAQSGFVPVGCPGGRLRRAPLRPSQLWGRWLPTCLPLTVVFPPELQICLGFAVIWPGARLGRPALPAGCGPAAGGSGGCGRGAEPGPPLGLGVLGNWDSAFWGIFARVIVLVSGLKHPCGVPAVPAPSSSAACIPGDSE